MSRVLRPVLALLTIVSVLAVGPAPAAADHDDPVVVTINGRGFGHGRGMGQWGAQGYALDFGWSSAQILDHFYRTTTAAQVPSSLAFGIDPDILRVDIRSTALNGANTGQIDAPLRFEIGAGGLVVSDASGLVEIDDIPAGSAGQITRNGALLELRHKPSGCGGDWSGGDVTVVPIDASVQAIDVRPAVVTSGIDGLVRVCHTDGSSTWYEGWIRGASVVEGGVRSLRTVNVVSIEQYLRGVVPEEVFTSWEPAALEAQAVAARSYALAGDSRYRAGTDTNFADTCDTIRCQVYSGRFNQSAGGPIEQVFADSTDAAISATDGLVRVFGDGSVARTEFSASTGGYTVDAEALGGFPAVEDLGDATAANPNRSWQVTVDLTDWVAAKGLGRLLAIDEVDRTGNGPDGGHVNRVDFVFEDGTISLTGDQVRNSSLFPATLKSRWFTFADDGLDLLTANRAYVDAVYDLFLQRSPTDGERSEAVTALLAESPRFLLTSSLSLSPEWAGVEIDDLYPIVFSRPADPGGRAFWLEQMSSGRRLQSVAAEFYGSPEFFDKVGNNHRAFVRSLYEEIQGRDPDGGGLTYWTDQLDSGAMSRTQVAAGFYASIESREGRVIALYQQVLGRNPDGGGLAFWADQLLTRDDVALAAELAASAEYFSLAQSS